MLTASRADKVRARKALNHAVAAGRVVPQPCGECSAPKAQAHHDDYSKPLQVRWLCAGCHSKLHNQKHPLTKPCAECGALFTPHPTKRLRAVTCSRRCHSLRARAQVARLSVEQMRGIKARYAAGGVTLTALGVEYGVNRGRISQIVHGKASLIAEVNDAV